MSGYTCDLYEEIFELHDGWQRIDADENTMHTTKDTRQESLWVNYEPPNRDVEAGANVDSDQRTLGESV